MKLQFIEPRLAIADLQRSLSFWRDRLGFCINSTWPNQEPCFAIVTRDGIGVQLSASEKPVGATTLSFNVDDVLAWHAALQSHVEIAWGPEVYSYGCREFAILDPDGHMLIFSSETDDPATCNIDE